MIRLDPRHTWSGNKTRSFAQRETQSRCGTRVDWQRESPYVFESVTAKGLEEMQRGGCLMARKIEVWANIINITRRSIP